MISEPFPFPRGYFVLLWDWTCYTCSSHNSYQKALAYHPGTWNTCLIKAYIGLILNGGNEKRKTKQQLFIYGFILN